MNIEILRVDDDDDDCQKQRRVLPTEYMSAPHPKLSRGRRDHWGLASIKDIRELADERRAEKFYMHMGILRGLAKTKKSASYKTHITSVIL